MRRAHLDREQQVFILISPHLGHQLLYGMADGDNVSGCGDVELDTRHLVVVDDFQTVLDCLHAGKSAQQFCTGGPGGRHHERVR